MNSILIFYIKSSGGRRISPDRGVPPLVFREGWAIGDGPTSRKVYAAWASAIYLIITSRLFFPNRRAQDFAPERESRRYSLQEKAFDGLSKGRAYSAGQTREAGIVAARRGVRSRSRR